MRTWLQTTDKEMHGQVSSLPENEETLKIRGKVFKYGDNVNTDAIMPARFLNISDPVELAKHTMEGLDTSFVSTVRPGDILVAGQNFGCGSSREHAPLAIKTSGISTVIAASFARIFFRNAINIGLPVLESADAVRGTESGDTIEVDLAKGNILNISKGLSFQAKPLPDFLLELMKAGGLVEHTKKRLQKGK